MTPEEILSHPPRVLTEKQREYYFENGYVTVEGAISDEWLERLRAVTEEMIEKSRPLIHSNDVFTLEDGHSFENPRLRRLTNLVTHHPVYWEFASQSPMAAAAADVVGSDVKFYHSKLNFKWAKGGQDFKWHQDIQAWPHTTNSLTTIGTLHGRLRDDAGPADRREGDSQWTAPQHVRRPRTLGPPHSGGEAARQGALGLPHRPGRNARPPQLPYRAGSLHNEAARSRPFLLNVYSSADAFAYRPNPLPNPYEGTIVRGKPARWAHHDPRPCEIPPDWSSGYLGPWTHQKQGAAGEGSAKTGGY